MLWGDMSGTADQMGQRKIPFCISSCPAIKFVIKTEEEEGFWLPMWPLHRDWMSIDLPVGGAVWFPLPCFYFFPLFHVLNRLYLNPSFFLLLFFLFSPPVPETEGESSSVGAWLLTLDNFPQFYILKAISFCVCQVWDIFSITSLPLVTIQSCTAHCSKGSVRQQCLDRLPSPCSLCNPPQGDSCNTSLKKKWAENVRLRSSYGNCYAPLCRDLAAVDLPFCEAVSLVAAERSPKAIFTCGLLTE